MLGVPLSRGAGIGGNIGGRDFWKDGGGEGSVGAVSVENPFRTV
jgi:hypothetical protein